MRAIVYFEYGSPDVLQLRDVDDPVPGDNAVLVRVRAAAANPYDWHFMRGEPFFMRLFCGLRAPKRKGLGLDFSGLVEAVGPEVKELRPGDEVFGMCDGAFAECLVAPADVVARKPSNLTFEQAAAVPLAGLTALQGLRDAGELQPGQRVLIIGAGGGVGTFAVQIAKSLGAHVTGVCSTEKQELVRSLGADDVIDYTREDYTRGSPTYDVIFQLAGMDSPSRCRRALTRDGKLVMSSGDSNGRWFGPVGRILRGIASSPFVSQTIVSLLTRRSKEDLEHLAEMIEEGALAPVIDRTHPLDEVPDAIRHLEEGHARGKIVITV